jgi:purine nucleoside permease
MARVWLSLLALALLGLGSGPALAAPARKPIEIRVVIVTTWEAFKDGKDVGGELYAWEHRWPLARRLPFPVGVHDLEYDPARHVLALVTGEATARAAASIVALGMDPRFDLTHAYWIVAGTAGVDPRIASAGSAAWARWVVDGDLAQELDARDMPAGWPAICAPRRRARRRPSTPTPPMWPMP